MEATKAPRTSGAPRRRNAAATPQATNSRPPRMKGILLEMAVLALWVYFIVCTRPQRIADVSTPKLDESEVAMPARQMDIVAAALEPIIDYQGTASERVSQTYQAALSLIQIRSQAQHIIDTRVLPSMYQLRAEPGNCELIDAVDASLTETRDLAEGLLSASQEVIAKVRVAERALNRALRDAAATVSAAHDTKNIFQKRIENGTAPAAARLHARTLQEHGKTLHRFKREMGTICADWKELGTLLNGYLRVVGIWKGESPEECRATGVGILLRKLRVTTWAVLMPWV